VNSDFELTANAMPAAPWRVTGIRVVPGSRQKNIWTLENSTNLRPGVLSFNDVRFGQVPEPGTEP
jgi:hypothetical protein